MAVAIKPSDFKFRYPRDIKRRNEPKFQGIPDQHPFNRDDLYEILPVMEAVMNELDSCDGRVLHLLEDILNEMPRFIVNREETYRYLLQSARECLRP